MRAEIVVSDQELDKALKLEPTEGYAMHIGSLGLVDFPAEHNRSKVIWIKMQKLEK